MAHKLLGVLLAATGLACADSIRVGGKLYEGVYVSTGSHLYYIMNPADGAVINVRKTDVNPNNVHFTQDPAERRALLDAWNSKQPEPSPTGAVAGPDASVPTPIASKPDKVQEKPSPSDFLQRKRIETLVEFEAELQQWVSRPEEEQAEILAALLSRLVEQQGQQALSLLATEMARAEADIQLDALESQATAHNEALAKSRADEAKQVTAALQPASNDRYRRTLEKVLAKRNTERSAGIYSVRTDDRVSKAAARVTAQDAQRNIRASSIATQHQAERQPHEVQLGALQREAAAIAAQEQQAELQAARRARLASANAYRAGAQLERLALMELYIQEGYVSPLRYERIGSWEGRTGRATAPFKVSGPVWKVEIKSNGAGRLRLKVFSENENRMLKLTPWFDAPGSDFLVLNDPGEFHLEIETDGTIPYAVEAFEVAEEEE